MGIGPAQLLLIAAIFPTSLAAGTTLEWMDVSCALSKKKGGKTKLILDKICGRALPGRMLAIMGPSGSGKSSVLNAVAGQMGKSKGLVLEGRLLLNGEECPDGSLPSDAVAYVKQDDLFYAQMTVRETLMFAARLRLPRSMPLATKRAKVIELMDQLGLTKAADTVVGDAKTRGISGGERKRLSIACELIGEPSVLFLDEPTSGLDSFQAERLIEVMGRLARDQQKTIVMVIHQPSQRVFESFDDLILVSEGKLLYSGPLKGVRSFFARAGMPVPRGVSAQEWCLQQISIDGESAETKAASVERITRLQQLQRPFSISSTPLNLSLAQDINQGVQAVLWTPEAQASLENVPFFVRKIVRTRTEEYARGLDTRNQNTIRITKEILFAAKKKQDDTDDNSKPVATTTALTGRGGKKGYPSTLLEQYRLLFARSWREVSRAKLPTFIKVMQQVMTALIYGGIYSLDNSQVSIQERFGLISLVTIGAANLGVASTIRAFPKEKTIVTAERSKGLYGVAPYFLSKLVAEVPLAVGLSGLFGGLLYPMVGFQRSARKFLQFLGISTLQSFAATALGMLVGAAAPTSDAALALFPPLVVLMVIFNGFNISDKSTPRLLRWVPKVSLIRWGFEGLAINEFHGLTFQKGPINRGPSVLTGEEALGRLALDKSTVMGAVSAQGRLLAGCYAGTYAMLRSQRSAYAPMKRPGAIPVGVRPF